jgi:hypothetical protein
VADNIGIRTRRRFGWFSPKVAILLGLVGLIFLAYAATSLSRQLGASTTGIVGACTGHAIGGNLSRPVVHTCDVTWSGDSATHTTSLDVGEGDFKAGQSIDLRVSGDSAVEATPPLVGAATAVVGLALIAVVVVPAVRQRRQRA